MVRPDRSKDGSPSFVADVAVAVADVAAIEVAQKRSGQRLAVQSLLLGCEMAALRVLDPWRRMELAVGSVLVLVLVLVLAELWGRVLRIDRDLEWLEWEL